MPVQERVTDYTVAVLRNDVVAYQQVVRLTTETGHHVFIGFPEVPPQQWLTLTGTDTTIYLQAGEFDRIHHLLQTENPLYFTAINVIGLRAFNLTTAQELPGEGPADDDALAQLAAKMRQGGDATD